MLLAGVMTILLVVSSTEAPLDSTSPHFVPSTELSLKLSVRVSINGMEGVAVVVDELEVDVEVEEDVEVEVEVLEVVVEVEVLVEVEVEVELEVVVVVAAAICAVIIK